MGIPTVGKALIADRVGAVVGGAAATYLAYGDSATAFAAGQTALQGSELQRAAATVSRVTTNVTNDTLQLVKAFSITDTETAREGGVFNAAGGGTMLARVVYDPARSMGDGDTLTYTHKIVFA